VSFPGKPILKQVTILTQVVQQAGYTGFVIAPESRGEPGRETGDLCEMRSN
jgi:hypothetical protein